MEISSAGIACNVEVLYSFVYKFMGNSGWNIAKRLGFALQMGLVSSQDLFIAGLLRALLGLW